MNFHAFNSYIFKCKQTDPKAFLHTQLLLMFMEHNLCSLCNIVNVLFGIRSGKGIARMAQYITVLRALWGNNGSYWCREAEAMHEWSMQEENLSSCWSSMYWHISLLSLIYVQSIQEIVWPLYLLILIYFQSIEGIVWPLYPDLEFVHERPIFWWFKLLIQWLNCG